MTDLAVVLFVAVLVLGGLYVPRIGDALGRALRRRGGADRADGGDQGSPPAR